MQQASGQNEQAMREACGPRATRRFPRQRGTSVQWRDRIVRLDRIPAAQLTAHGSNWRVHPQTQQAMLGQLLGTVGMAGALLVYDSVQHGGLTILDGHMRAGMDPGQAWPCLVLDVTDEEAALLLATYDPLGAMAGRDQAQLDALLAGLGTVDGLDSLLASLSPPVGDPAPPAPGTRHPCPPDAGARLEAHKRLHLHYETGPGQVWSCGRHTLLCGDASLPESYAVLLEERQPALCLTDPPYGVGEDYASHEDSPENLAQLIADFLPIVTSIAPVTLITTGTKHMYAYPRPDWVLGWVCPAGVGVGPWGFCCWHPVLAYGRDPYTRQNLGSRPDALVLNEASDKDLAHPCPKPLGVWQWIMERGSTTAGDIILDPFLGSGTSIIAAEMLDRTCFGIEKDPEYLAVALDRWERTTNTAPKRLI
jgi:DNA methylase